ncbi:uncharacterized protein ATNIH1004_010783 [Aspergillus tanneri]|uniref:Uncharacterized protein n=1 Tax=Aspergillus tanneri TaxID=1220188 RepID=A0A5M9M959_9EURO|nr:uncharacterized protein ATNIH1004_010783 [Aspergillus tanneri]KAA8641844.1 hypothetical protein ATNIH1004_010783 [Aspergillus tanneri]
MELKGKIPHPRNPDHAHKVSSGGSSHSWKITLGLSAAIQGLKLKAGLFAMANRNFTRAWSVRTDTRIGTRYL